MKKTIRAVFQVTIKSECPARCDKCDRSVSYICVTRRFTKKGRQEWIKYLCHTHMSQWVLRAKPPILNIEVGLLGKKPVAVYIEDERWMRA